MAHRQEDSPFTGFGIGKLLQGRPDEGVFILAVYRDGTLSAGAYATERGAMEAAAGLLDEEPDEDAEGGTLEDFFVRIQRLIADEGGLMEIIPSPVIDD